MVDLGTPDRLENVQEEVPGRGARNAGGCTYIQYVLREECWSLQTPVCFFSFFEGLKITKQKHLP